VINKKTVVHLLMEGTGMKFFDHLIVLTNHFEIGVETETTIAHISQFLNCSERHVKTIVHYLTKEGFIHWETHKGRGRKPRIKLLYPKEKLCLKEAMRMVKEENYQEAFQVVLSLSEPIRNEFQGWFMTHLGLSHHDTSEQELDVLRYPFYETNLSMDPLYIRSRHDSHMVQQIFDRLVEYDPATDVILPRVAHYWESSDGELWTFYLQKGVRFHHGRELTSNDVKATFDRLSKDDVVMRNIVSIKVKNNTVIQFQLGKSDYLFPRHLSNMKTSIVPIELVKGNESNFREFPVGSGPYQLTRHDEDLVRLEVFVNYFERRPWLDRIEIIKTPALFRWEGTHPFLLNAPDESWNQVRIMEEGACFITFNCRKSGPMRDIYFREQICNIVNPKEFCEKTGDKRVAHSFLTSQSRKNHVAEDRDRTKIQYQEEPLRIAAQQIRNGVNHEREALILQEQLIRKGISAIVEVVDLHLLNHPETYNKYDLFVGGIALAEDLLLSVIIALQSKKLTLYQCFSDTMREYVDNQVALMSELKEDSARWRIYFQIEEYLKSNFAIIFLTHRFHTVYKPNKSSYFSVELDSNGRVDYRKMWKK
jgi:SgrR family transcriptional regulator